MKSAKATDEVVVNATVVLPGLRSPRHPSRALRRGRNSAREYVREVQESRLIDAVVQVVAEQGYDAVGIRDICRCAGVAMNTFYEYFESKEAVFIAAYDAGVQIILMEMGKVYATGDVPWEDRIRAALDCFLHILSYNPAFACIFSVEAQKAGSAALNHIEATFAGALVMFADAVPVQRLSMRPEELMPLALGGIYAGIYMYVRAGRVDRLPELLDNLTAFIGALFEGRDAGSKPVKRGASSRTRARRPHLSPTRT